MPHMCLLVCLCFVNVLFCAEQRDAVFIDQDRQREIPYRVYYPSKITDALPVILFSHGLGGSKSAAAYFGKHLADNGYVSFHIQHYGSDSSVWKGSFTRKAIMNSLVASTKDPKNFLNRMQDVRVFLDFICKGEEHGFKGKLDLERIGMAGHSYGSKTTLLTAGLKIANTQISFYDERIKAGILMSPNRPEGLSKDVDDLFDNIKIPLLHLTGTNDAGVLPHQKNMLAEERCIPYQKITASQQYLLVFKDADHALFSGKRLGTAREKSYDQAYIALIKTVGLAFFDAQLKEKADQETFLKQGFVEQVKEHRYEYK